MALSNLDLNENEKRNSTRTRKSLLSLVQGGWVGKKGGVVCVCVTDVHLTMHLILTPGIIRRVIASRRRFVIIVIAHPIANRRSINCCISIIIERIML
jgi:hypothetical protein